jgi:hypothetical protein
MRKIIQLQTLISFLILFGFPSCVNKNEPKLLDSDVEYTVVTRDNDSLVLSSKFSFLPGDDVLVWIWVSKTLNGLCGFVLRPYNDSKPLPSSDQNIHYTLVAATVIPNKSKSLFDKLPTKGEINNSKSPCEKYINLNAEPSQFKK